ncbi:D-glycero-beta-D-manno-heptose-7-phosphate kinase [candidate division KSB1 bacterium]|nr:D-glycero-beta-D-manno-heptose-7-phosphate kinase [candidate division KSB1 bacterium]
MKKNISSAKDIRAVIRQMQSKRILVLGDIMLDEYIWGKVMRISPEAPVPVVHVTRETFCPGGASNVARNLADFGLQTYICGLAGKDSDGRKLIGLLNHARINSDGLLLRPKFTTIVKTRIIARHQQVVRVDREATYQLTQKDLHDLASFLQKIIPTIDAIIIEDYGKGLVTQTLVDLVVTMARENNKLVTVDPNVNNPLHWQGATLVKPNRQEAFAAASLPYREDAESLKAVGEKLLQLWRIPYLLITLGEGGMMLFEQNRPPFHSPTLAREVFDVSGAGDTAIAFCTAALTSGTSARQATEIANHAAGIVIGKLGTATLTADELLQSFNHHE